MKQGSRGFWFGVLVGSGLCACSERAVSPELHGSRELVFLHIADLHSELFPRTVRVGYGDEKLGLGAAGESVAVGGLARLSALIQREREWNPHLLLFDSGDAVEGAAVFNVFQGEPELLSLSALGVAAQVLGNHELDGGAARLRKSYQRFAAFPLLAVNLLPLAEGGALSDVIEPWTVIEAGELRIGVIGVANPTSPATLRDRSNPFQVAALDSAEAVQQAIDTLRPDVDLIVVLTHLGLDADQALVQKTTGIDLVLGGHQHLALPAPEEVFDCSAEADADGAFLRVHGARRRCAPRRVLIVHSGAFGKFVGRLALRVSDDPDEIGGKDALDRFEVVNAELELLPVTEAAGEDPALAELLDGYRGALGPVLDATPIAAYAPRPLERFSVTNGDAPLGNLIAAALRARAEADLALVNSSGIRADLAAGALTPESWYGALPFDDSVVRVSLFGRDLAALFRELGKRTAAQSCRSAVQVAGARVLFECAACASSTACTAEACAPTAACATVWIAEPGLRCRSAADCPGSGALCAASEGMRELGCFLPLAAERVYTVATTTYLASGPSDYEALGRGSARVEVDPSARDVVQGFAREARKCGAISADLALCRAGIAGFYGAECADPASATALAGCALGRSADELAGELCEILPCVVSDRDGRVEARP